jgi:hypothetical protein
MALAHSVLAIRTAFQIRFPDKTERLTAMRTAYLSLYDAKGSGGDFGRTLTSFSADGQTATWAIGLPAETVVAAFATALQIEEGTASSKIRLYAAD